MILFLFDFLLFISFQVDEGGQLLLQNGRTATDSLFRIQGAVGFQVDNQLIEVGTLLDTSGFDRVGNTANRLKVASSCRRPIARVSSSEPRASAGS